MYLPDPTWGNHVAIMQEAGLEVKRYRYCDRKTCTLDCAGLLEDIASAPDGSIFLLHACAHNPTGVDPSEAQWDEISQAILKKGLTLKRGLALTLPLPLPLPYPYPYPTYPYPYPSVTLTKLV